MAAKLHPFEEIAHKYAREYYNRIQNSRDTIGGLYGPNSMLTWEGAKIPTAAKIQEKIKSLPKLQYKIEKVDAQPMPNNSIIVLVVGKLKIDADNPINFTQSFTLLPNPNKAGSYYCHNDIMRMLYG